MTPCRRDLREGLRVSRAELHLAYRLPRQDATRVTFGWKDDQGVRQASHVFQETTGTWTVPTGRGVETLWVEYEPEVRKD
jgi:hypothetical protein